jgi:protein SCO1/2
MNNRNKISTNKICAALSFICAAIMMSVFVFHTSHKPASIQTSDKSVVFPVGRDIKDFSLVTSKEKEFTQKDLREHWTLMFFGFTHCPSICPTTLSMLSKAYTQLKPTYPNLQVVLVSLDPERDSTTALAKYTANFNPDIIGVSGKIQDLRKLQSQLGVYSERSEEGKSYTLQHTSSIFLISPQGKWVGMFKFGMGANTFVSEFNANMKQLEEICA